MTDRAGYRADIDGLRAIAVLSVLFYHLRPAWMPGGFVGVDIFFVISGYLIGGQTYREAKAGTFGFAAFYARRARRILPALIVVVALTLLFGLLCMTPPELYELGKESFAALLGASNIYFFLGQGYFGPGADHLPLLMTWSLGVEEQFYLFFPPLLLLMLRFGGGKSPGPWVAAATLISFMGSLWLTGADAKAAFYLLPTRAWELLLGALIAIGEVDRDGKRWLSGRRAGLASLVGLASIGGALFLYRPAFAFPGLFAALPTIGAALLLLGEVSPFNRQFLSLMPMRFVGWISYSLYLWHWPLLYLCRLLMPDNADVPLLPVLAITFLLSTLSWLYVEQPMRRRRLPQGTVLIRYAGVLAAFCGLSLFLVASRGWPERLPPPAWQIAMAAAGQGGNPCLALYGEDRPRPSAACLGSEGGRAARIALLGDSHANALAPGLRAKVEDGGGALAQITKASCLPLLGYAEDIADRPSHFAQCLHFQDRAFRQVMEDRSIDTVILAGFWSAVETAPLRARDGRSAGAPLEGLRDALGATVAALEKAGKRVVLVQDVPLFDFDPYARLVGDRIPLRRAAMQTLRQEAAADGGGEARADASSRSVKPDAGIAVVKAVAAAHPAVLLADPRGGLCDGAACRYAAGERLYYLDWQHLTPDGARAAVRGWPL